jgi:enamine deaminase RidA (YjgF/YER057c/UK114 family)
MESEVSVDGVIALGATEVNRYAGAEIAMSNLDMAVSGGPYVFTTGYVGMDKGLHRAIAGPEDLEEGPGRLLNADCASARGAIRAQAWHVYTWILRMLTEIDSSGDRVVQQTIYVRDRHDVPEILSFCRQAFMGRLPPTTVVGVEDIGPYPGLLFEVDVIAVRS